MRNKYKLTVITIKRAFEETDGKGQPVMRQHVLGVPNSSTKIQKDDTLMVFGTIKDIEKFYEIN